MSLLCWLLGLLIADKHELILNIEVSKKMILFIRVCLHGLSILLNILYSTFGLSQTISMGLFSLSAAYWISQEISYWNNTQPKKYLVKFGKWSYSLYLCHMIALAVLFRFGITESFLFVLLQRMFASLVSYLFTC